MRYDNRRISTHLSGHLDVGDLSISDTVFYLNFLTLNILGAEYLPTYKRLTF